MHSLHGVCVLGGGTDGDSLNFSLISYIRSRGGWGEEGLTPARGPLGTGTGHGPTLAPWQGQLFFPVAETLMELACKQELFRKGGQC